jgi:protein-L-isoaspartate(D-aspartate) O-methyltransferase
MKKVDRKKYCLDETTAYQDCPQSVYYSRPAQRLKYRRIGYSATISAPHMHAHAVENLLPFLPSADTKGGAILDVGSGSGYCKLPQPCLTGHQADVLVTAVFHRLAPHASVVGIEHIEELAEQSKENLEADGVQLGSAEGGGGVEIVHGDGRKGKFP